MLITVGNRSHSNASFGSVILLTLLLLFPPVARLVAADIDSLKQELKQVEERATLDIMNELSKAYRFSDPAKSLRFGELAVDLARSLNHYNGEAQAQENIGLYYNDQRDFRDALDHLNLALKLYEQAGNDGGLARSYNNLGFVYENLSQNDQALGHYLRALMIYEDLDDQLNLAVTLRNVGEIYNQWEQKDKALRFFNRAYEIYSAEGDLTGQIRSLVRMGQTHLDRGEYDLAEKTFTDGLALSSEGGDSLHLATTYASLGNLYEAQGRYQEALDYHTRALDIKRKIGTPVQVANTLLHIGQVYQQAGNFTRSLQNFREALDILSQAQAPRELAITQKQIGVAYLKAANYKSAARYLKESLQTAQGIEALDLIQDAYKQLSTLYSLTNDTHLALSYSNKYQDTRDRIHEQQSNRRLAELEISYELDKRNKELDLLKQQSIITELDYRKKANLLVSILTFSIVISMLFVGFLVYRQRFIRTAEKEKLENILRMKADFTAMLVHDLRSPLTSVFGYAELLKMGNKEASKVREIATTITQASQKMLLLVNEMLDFSKFEAGKMTITPEETNLRTLVGTSIQMLKPIAAQKESNIEFVYEEDLPRVECDSRKVEQVITNLLGNAVKHTPDETTVLCRLQRVTEGEVTMVEFSVEDDGPGIDPEYQKTIFDKYAQLEKEHETINLGTGLGLAVSKMIIDAHGGHIGYRPGEPHGSVFYFRLLLNPVPAADPAEAAP